LLLNTSGRLNTSGKTVTRTGNLSQFYSTNCPLRATKSFAIACMPKKIQNAPGTKGSTSSAAFTGLPMQTV